MTDRQRGLGWLSSRLEITASRGRDGGGWPTQCLHPAGGNPPSPSCHTLLPDRCAHGRPVGLPKTSLCFKEPCQYCADGTSIRIPHRYAVFSATNSTIISKPCQGTVNLLPRRGGVSRALGNTKRRISLSMMSVAKTATQVAWRRNANGR